MEPQGCSRNSPIQAPKDAPSKPSLPQKNAYARLVQKHHSGRFRSYLNHISQKLQLAENTLGDLGSEAEPSLKRGLVREVLLKNGTTAPAMSPPAQPLPPGQLEQGKLNPPRDSREDAFAREQCHQKDLGSGQGGSDHEVVEEEDHVSPPQLGDKTGLSRPKQEWGNQGSASRRASPFQARSSGLGERDREGSWWIKGGKSDPLASLDRIGGSSSAGHYAMDLATTSSRKGSPSMASRTHGADKRGSARTRNNSESSRAPPNADRRWPLGEPHADTMSSSESRMSLRQLGTARGGIQAPSSTIGDRKSRSKAARGRKKIFESYMSREDVSAGLKRKMLIQGPLRINPKKYHEAFIPSPDGTRDIFIDGVVARNRALNGDIVVVKLLPKDQWKVNKPDGCEGEADAAHGSEAPGDSPGAHVLPVPGKGDASSPGVIVEAELDDSGSVEGDQDHSKVAQELKQVSLGAGGKGRDLEISDACHGQLEDSSKTSDPDQFLQKTAKVVYILERKHSRAATGFIRLLADRNSELFKKCAMFSPVDHRVPRTHVPLAECPPDFTARPEDYASTLFVCRIVDWKEDSNFAIGESVKILSHPDEVNLDIESWQLDSFSCEIEMFHYSSRHLAQSLGQAGEIEPETEGILMEYGVDFSEFSPEVLQCLPQSLPWVIPLDELAKRRDLRQECIFTIDPSTAKDLDDALSCKQLPDGNLEVGVHIADVSYFVLEGTELDAAASRRATSVYLVQKVIPMLPKLLCEELCSLNPMTDRLTFSVIWKLTPEGKILDEWFGRTVISSCAKLSYDHAQRMIENPEKAFSPEELPPISPQHSAAEVHRAVLHLHRIAQQLRKQRFVDGALRLDQLKLAFTLDPASGMPQGCYIYQYRDSNKLVEEFMLLANMAVAHQIYRAFPSKALLRRHPPPQTKMLSDLVEFCNQMGLDIDCTNAGTLHKSLNETFGDDKYAEARKEVLTNMFSRPMQMAVYFCAGTLEDETLFRHYALNVPLYTHFTSPIRRFPDILVHRLLSASLGSGPPPQMEEAEMQKQAEHCNDRKMASKRVQELSADLFFAVFVKECGPLESEAMVMGVLNEAFDVLVLRFGVQKRIYCNALPLVGFQFQKSGRKPQLTLLWEPEDAEQEAVQQVITVFTLVEVVLRSDNVPLKYSATLKRPEGKGGTRTTG